VTESSTSPLVGCSRPKAAYSLSSDDDEDVKEVVVVLDISTVLNWTKDPQVLQPLFPSLTPSSSSSSFYCFSRTFHADLTFEACSFTVMRGPWSGG
jgi:hypothetical protein